MLKRIWLGIKLFCCYSASFLPCCPKIGELAESDCIFVQAFGRNSIPDESPDESLGKEISGILSKANSLNEAFTFFAYQGFDPGKPNRVLAKKAIRLAKRFNIPIIAQWEIVYAIWQENPLWFFDNQGEIDCVWPPESGYFATMHVKLASREMMRKRGKKKPIEVAHPAMLPRAVAILWKLKLEIVVEPVRPWSFFRSELWVWDKESIQPWTTAFIRSAVWKCFLPREALGRMHHILLKRWVSFIPPISA